MKYVRIMAIAFCMATSLFGCLHLAAAIKIYIRTGKIFFVYNYDVNDKGLIDISFHTNGTPTK